MIEARQSLFEHAANAGEWRIDTAALSDSDLEVLAQLAGSRLHFGRVEGVGPTGERFADALRRHATSGPLLLAGDVLVSGATMTAARGSREALGVVIFARGACPDWVTPLFCSGDVLAESLAQLDELKQRINYYQPAEEDDAVGAVESLGQARNNLFMQADRLEERASMVDDAAAILLALREQHDDASPLALATRRWLAHYDSLSAYYGC